MVVYCGTAVVMVQANKNVWTRRMESMVLMLQQRVLVWIIMYDSSHDYLRLSIIA